MVVATTIALYASTPSSVCSTPHQIHAYDLDLSSRSSSASPSLASSPQKPIGGLSSLFSGASVKSSASIEEFSDLKDLSLSSSFCYSPAKFMGSSYHRRDHQSPNSVLHGPVSYSCSPPIRISRDRNLDGSFRVGATGLFNRFVRKAVGSCVDYELGSSSVDELTFSMEDGFGAEARQPYARDLLRRAQLRHKIFEWKTDVASNICYQRPLLPFKIKSKIVGNMNPTSKHM